MWLRRIPLFAIAALSACGNSKPPVATSAPQIQIVNDFGRAVSLDSTAAHTWWITTAHIDVTAESQVSALTGVDRPDPHWETAPIPNHAVKTKENPEFVWLRKTIDIQDTYPENIALRLGAITDSDRVYLNGKLVGASGNWESSSAQTYDKIRLYRVSDNVWRPGLNVILIQCKSYFPGTAGIQKDRTAVGPADRMFADLYITVFQELALLVVYLTAGVYFFFLFLRRRKEKENMVFGLLVFNLVVYQFLRTQAKYLLEWDFLFSKQAEYAALFLTVPLVCYFIRTFFELPKTRLVTISDWVNAIVAVVLVGCSIMALAGADIRLLDSLNKRLSQPLWIIMVATSIGIVTFRLFQRDADARYMAAGVAVALVTLVTDILSNRNVFNLPPLSGYGFVTFVMSLALILANRFVRLNEKVEDLNKNLEEKVEQRTSELNKTLGEVQELKQQQDGDYFLTSLLLRPLNSINDSAPNVMTSVLTEQKKRFHFRKWHAELGGDVASTYQITLRGRPFTAFINADAMGKSMQGAGGALVLGTVFKNVVARTQSGGVFSNRYPESWIKECFVELQNVFVSFEGTMMASAVLGVVDDSNGMLYYVNAEHPLSVLYRNGSAAFIEKQGEYMRKIGVQGMDAGLRVGAIRLRRGDIVIIGSDGRDDIATGTDERGQRTISEDTEIFLAEIIAAGGDLSAIVEQIRARGEITDDLSLLRITYAGPPLPDEPPTELINTARSHVSRGEYQAARESLEHCHELDPESTEILFQLATVINETARARREVHEGLDIAERVRLRDPENIGNLLLVSGLYRKIGNMEKHKEYLNKARAAEEAG